MSGQVAMLTTGTILETIGPRPDDPLAGRTAEERKQEESQRRKITGYQQVRVIGPHRSIDGWAVEQVVGKSQAPKVLAQAAIDRGLWRVVA